MATAKRVNGRPYKTAKARLRRQAKACWLCGKPIDTKLLWPDPMSFSVDHVVPVSLGGNENSYANMRAAHLGCNQSRGNGEPRKNRTSKILDNRPPGW